jgi:hypothetical protein
VPELEPGGGSPRRTARLVIAGRLGLLSLAGLAALWAFAFSGGRGHSATGPVGHVHAQTAAGHDEHAHHGHHHRGSTVAQPDDPGDHKVVGTAQRRVFTLEVRAPAWLEAHGVVTAVLRKDQLDGLAPGARGVFFSAAAPSAGRPVRLSGAAPASWDAATSRVQFRVESRGAGPRPGEVGWVQLAARSREVLLIPSSALLYSPAGPYVLAADADGGAPAKRRVEIGSVSRGLAVVLAGLEEGEPIVIGSAFSWDAERRLQSRREEIGGVAR